MVWYDFRRDYRPPPRAFRIGMWVFLASLAVLFGSSLLGYVLMRFGGPLVPKLGSVATPRLFWWSTGLLLVGSVFLQWALINVRQERLVAFRWQMLMATAFCFGFLAVQGPAVVELLKNHSEAEMAIDSRPIIEMSPDDQEYLRATRQAAPRKAQLYAYIFTPGCHHVSSVSRSV
jgi:heme/copper-type cytochrome/quinol oxidase subunit 3